MILFYALLLSFSLSGLLAFLWVGALDRAEDRRMSMIDGPHRLPRASLRRMRKNRADLRRALGRKP